jgi:hypothetical protein
LPGTAAAWSKETGYAAGRRSGPSGMHRFFPWWAEGWPAPWRLGGFALPKADGVGIGSRSSLLGGCYSSAAHLFLLLPNCFSCLGGCPILTFEANRALALGLPCLGTCYSSVTQLFSGTAGAGFPPVQTGRRSSVSVQTRRIRQRHRGWQDAIGNVWGLRRD